MQGLTMVNIVFVGLCDLRTCFGTYENFISVLWNDFSGTGMCVVYCIKRFIEPLLINLTHIEKLDYISLTHYTNSKI